MQRKVFLTILNLTFPIAFFGQSDSECFKDKKMQHDLQIRSLPPFSPKDTVRVNNLLAITEETKKNVIGCVYPNLTLKPASAKSFQIHKIKSDFVIINFSYVYGGTNSLKQLDDLDSIKRVMKSRVTIISLYSHNTKEIQPLIDQYGKSITFIPDFAQEQINYYNLGLGTPTTFVLEKSKHIMYVASGAYPDTGHLYKELLQFLK